MIRMWIMFKKWIKEIVERGLKDQHSIEKELGIVDIMYGMRENLERYSQFLSSFNMQGDMDNNKYIPEIILECNELGKDLNDSVQKMKRIINQTKECLKDVSITRE